MQMMPQIQLETKQTISQQQIQFLEILAMDSVELEAFLNDEYMNNPLLEQKANNDIHESLDSYSVTYENPYTGGNYVYDKEDEREDGRNFVCPNKDYVKEYITNQLDIQKYSKEEWKMIHFMIDSLEDDGFFKLETAEISRLTGKKEEFIQRILSLLRDLEPHGIFAKNINDCLLKQLELMGIDNPILNEMIADYLVEISEGKISVISRNLKISTAEVRKYIAIISKLNPKPLSGLQGSEVSYIVPDIIFEKNNHKWEIKINDNWFGEYSINDYYIKMMKETKDPDLSDYFGKKLERSRFVLSCIEQRRKTIQTISEIILDNQKDYFDGNSKLKPITMAEVAKQLGIHPSTVTRAIKGKYLQYPKETVLMKDLFATVVSSDESGEDLSASHIKEKIKIMVDREDKKKPLSDAKIAELLKSEGIHISRRAVAKYRDELLIKSSFNRKII